MTDPPPRLYAHPTKAGPGCVVWRYNDRPGDEAVAFIPESRYLEAVQVARETLELMERCSWAPTMSGTRVKAQHDRIRSVAGKLDRIS